MSLEFEIDLSQVERGWQGMVGRAERGDAFFKELTPSARKDLKEHKQARRGPEGKWPARSIETRRRARRKSKLKRRKGRTAGLLGKLPQTYKVYTSPDHLKMLHRVSWAGAHNAGATIGNKARLPAREFAYWSPAFQESVAAQFLAYVIKGYTQP